MNDSSISTWSSAVADAFNEIISRLADFLPNLIGAVIILILGWIVALVLEQVIDRVLRAINIQRLFERARLEDLVRKTGSKRDTVGLLAGLVKWIAYIATFMSAANILGLKGVETFFNEILTYTPNVVVAVAILLVGGILAQFMSEVVRGAVSAANLGYAGFLGGLTRWSIWVFAILAALLQLGVASDIIRIFVTGLVAAISLATGLAFGLGGQKTAAELLDKVRRDFE